MKNIINNIFWQITTKCDNKCISCEEYCNKHEQNELNTNYCLEIIEELSDLGCKHITFTGGDPFLRIDLGILISACLMQNIEVSIISNPTNINKELINLIKFYHLKNLGIVIDINKKNLNTENLDKILTLLNKKHINTYIISLIHSYNYKILNSIKNIVINKKLKRWEIYIAKYEDKDKDKEIITFIKNTKKELKNDNKEIITYNQSNFVKKNFINISNDGHIIYMDNEEKNITFDIKNSNLKNALMCIQRSR